MKKNIILILSVLTGLVLSSCSDWLDVRPKTEVPRDDMFSKESGYEDALNGCYIKMNGNGLYGKFLTLSGIDFLARYYNMASSGTLEYGLTEFDYENEYVKSQIGGTYSDFYNVILQANDIITHIDSDAGRKAVKSETKRNLIKGEALAMRAYLHFDILRLFGQVPQNATITVQLPYSSITGTASRPLYDFAGYTALLLEDLNEAEKLMAEDPCIKNNLNTHVHEGEDDDFFHYRKFRFNYYAVKALQARVHLYLGNRQEAYRAAKSIIEAENSDGSRYFQLAGDNDFMLSHFAMPSETIMGLSNSSLEDNSNVRLFKNDATTFPMLFSKDRRDQLFDHDTGSNNRYSRWWGEVSNVTGTPNPYYKKYIQDEGGTGDSEKLNYKWLVPLLRLSEIYLIAMEATDDLAEANSLYTEYMLARNVQIVNKFSSLDEVKAQTVFEMRIEFMAEGQMFYTYKRTGATNMFFDHKEITEENYIVPIPDSELKMSTENEGNN